MLIVALTDSWRGMVLAPRPILLCVCVPGRRRCPLAFLMVWPPLLACTYNAEQG